MVVVVVVVVVIVVVVVVVVVVVDVVIVAVVSGGGGIVVVIVVGSGVDIFNASCVVSITKAAFVDVNELFAVDVVTSVGVVALLSMIAFMVSVKSVVLAEAALS